MPYYTPLRYPGGKRRLVPTITRFLDANRLTNIQYVEPYAGGAAIALALLIEEYASVVHINDLSRAVYAFWFMALENTADLCRKVELTKVTMAEWSRQRAVYDRRETASLDELGFATLFLNRTNRSGIISGGVIGGKKQTGEWLVDARFEKDELLRRIRKIGRYANRINLYQSDALEFTRNTLPGLGLNVFAFYDPPYIKSGKDLYLNDYSVDGHRELAKHICALRMPWVVTYDLAAVEHQLYVGHRRIVYGLNYSANGRHQGKEVMFLSRNLILPEGWRGGVRFPMAAPGSKHPVYGIMEAVKPHPGMIGSPEAANHFLGTLKTVISVPKSVVPSPLKKTVCKEKKPATRMS